MQVTKKGVPEHSFHFLRCCLRSWMMNHTRQITLIMEPLRNILVLFLVEIQQTSCYILMCSMLLTIPFTASSPYCSAIILASWFTSCQ